LTVATTRPRLGATIQPTSRRMIYCRVSPSIPAKRAWGKTEAQLWARGRRVLLSRIVPERTRVWWRVPLDTEGQLTWISKKLPYVRKQRVRLWPELQVSAVAVSVAGCMDRHKPKNQRSSSAPTGCHYIGLGVRESHRGHGWVGCSTCVSRQRLFEINRQAASSCVCTRITARRIRHQYHRLVI
jgi:hypothetical protein